MRTDAACPYCAKTDWTTGRLQGGHPINFVADDATVLQRLGKAFESADAMRCGSCGHVALFTPTT